MQSTFCKINDKNNTLDQSAFKNHLRCNYILSKNYIIDFHTAINFVTIIKREMEKELTHLSAVKNKNRIEVIKDIAFLLTYICTMKG